MVYVFLADGFEEIEALAVVDVLRRAGMSVSTVGVTGKVVRGSNDIPVVADTEDIALDSELEMIVLPGGIPGTPNLDSSDMVQRAIDYCVDNDIPMAAICAAPTIYGKRGLLRGKNAVCYPGMEEDMLGANIVSDGVCVDGRMITSKSAGHAISLGLAIVEYLLDKETAEDVRFKMYQDR
ncbi:MAG: DJ-1/PfpI family protein [Clostridia bacterium]|nr:DJ-1/PfpI family protein [Clostridia bacterium]